MLDGDGRDQGLSFSSPYVYSEHVLNKLGLEQAVPPWDFLPRRQTNKVLLNLIGKGDVCKGLPPSVVWEVIGRLAKKLPSVLFLVVYLLDEGQPEPPAWISAMTNLQIETAHFGSVKVTELYCGARLVVTSEGGGYHMAYGVGTPALLVTSEQWFAVVREYALPPIQHETVLFNASADSKINPVQIAKDIALWILDHLAH